MNLNKAKINCQQSFIFLYSPFYCRFHSPKTPKRAAWHWHVTATHVWHQWGHLTNSPGGTNRLGGWWFQPMCKNMLVKLDAWNHHLVFMFWAFSWQLFVSRSVTLNSFALEAKKDMENEWQHSPTCEHGKGFSSWPLSCSSFMFQVSSLTTLISFTSQSWNLIPSSGSKTPPWMNQSNYEKTVDGYKAFIWATKRETNAISFYWLISWSLLNRGLWHNPFL